MNPFRISLIVPIYKTEQTLKMCLDSVENQTFKEFEVILVNDGSPDGCAEICKTYAERDSRFRYIYKENGGLSDARNKGLEMARGEYVMFLDSDDAISRYTMEYLLKIIDETGAEIVSFAFTNQKRELDVVRPLEIHPEQTITNEVLKQYFFKEISVCNRIFKRELIGDTRFVVGQISEDVLFSFNCYQKAQRLYTTDYPFYYYNLGTTGSITRSGLAVVDSTAIEANEEMLRLCKISNPEYVQWAQLQLLKFKFDLVNKSVMRGFRNEEAEAYYKDVLPKYVQSIRRNIKHILNGATISKTDKLQMLILSVSFAVFSKLKKAYFEWKNR